MLNQQTIEKLYTMRMRGMADAFTQQQEDPQTTQLSFEERFALLVVAFPRNSPRHGVQSKSVPGLLRSLVVIATALRNYAARQVGPICRLQCRTCHMKRLPRGSEQGSLVSVRGRMNVRKSDN